MLVIPIPVDTSDFSSALSYYNTSPESPDGSKIAYTRFLDMPRADRSEKVPAELWVCNADLSDHKKIVEINSLAVHNGARVQWLDNKSFAYQDDSIRVIDLQGNQLIEPVEGRIGHETYNGRFLFSVNTAENKLPAIFEYDVNNNQIIMLGDALDFVEIKDLFPSENLRELANMLILHLQYSPDGSKIAFRMDIGPRNESYRHLITMNKDGSDIRYFGPKPMHFSWYDNQSIMGHDHQVDDGLPNDNSARRWNLDGNVIETLAGPGNHLAVSNDRTYYASESWYHQIPVILQVFRKGQTESFWQDTISTSKHTTWTLGNHANPSFSRDGKRVYFNKCIAPKKVKVYMASIPNEY